ncbi:VWA domain-containing protein, partial [Candidatus Poribacteria bacterium]|nr:VWA domain-containing protein [Candidatus Poribacteria bacterium]
MYDRWLVPAGMFLLLAAAAAALARADTSRSAALRSLLGIDAGGPVLRGRDPRRFRLVALVCAAAALAAASVGPRRSSFADAARADRDLLVVVDTSLSMAAEDAQPSRLGAAKQTIRALLQQAAGERVGVVAFAGSAIVQCPLTRDYSAVAMLTDSLQPGIIPQPGSALRDALFEAGRAFSSEPTRARVVVLITDGEDHSSAPEGVLAHLRKHDAALVAVCVGATVGAPIPIRDDEGRLLRYKRDRAGRLVSTKANPELLGRLAERAGGRFFHIHGRGAFGEVLDAVAQLDAGGG